MLVNCCMLVRWDFKQESSADDVEGEFELGVDGVVL